MHQPKLCLCAAKSSAGRLPRKRGMSNTDIRESRLVVMLDSQGFGLGSRLNNVVSSILAQFDARMTSWTAHPRSRVMVPLLPVRLPKSCVVPLRKRQLRSWPIAYHGTDSLALGSILKTGLRRAGELPHGQIKHV